MINGVLSAIFGEPSSPVVSDKLAAKMRQAYEQRAHYEMLERQQIELLERRKFEERILAALQKPEIRSALIDIIREANGGQKDA